jgi:catechol-2,3-dioxygenase
MMDASNTGGDGAMSRVVNLGHVGIYVRDLERMVAFYRDFLGMQVTKQNWKAGMVFLSTDPARTDHEIALMTGRAAEEQPPLIQQISLRVETLDDVRDFYRRILEDGYEIDHIVSHCSAIGCYFRDPEGNRTEVFWLTGRPCWVPAAEPVDLTWTDEEIMAVVDRQWDKLGHVAVGGVLESAMAVPA